MLYKIENRKYAFTAIHIQKLLPTPHIHSHLEFIYLKKGASIAVLDNNNYLLEAGDLFITFPNQIHYYHVKSSVEGYMIIFTPTLFQELKEIFCTKISENPILHRNQLPSDICSRLEKICEKLSTDFTYDEIAARGHLLALWGEILPFITLADSHGEQDTIKNILKYCVENYTQPLSLELLSKELHLNKYYISHIFQERMHICFKDFINNLRVECACSLLGKSSSITDVAYTSGFSSVRTFNRAFLKYMQMTPREYIRQKMSDEKN